MNFLDHRVLIGVGLVLMLIGFALPALMIMQIVESTFLLNFLSYAASFVGLSMGMLGVVMIVVRSRHRD